MLMILHKQHSSNIMMHFSEERCWELRGVWLADIYPHPFFCPQTSLWSAAGRELVFSASQIAAETTVSNKEIESNMSIEMTEFDLYIFGISLYLLNNGTGLSSCCICNISSTPSARAIIIVSLWSPLGWGVYFPPHQYCNSFVMLWITAEKSRCARCEAP